MDVSLIISIISALITAIGALLTIKASIETRRALALAETQNEQAVAQTNELKQLAGKQNEVTDEISVITSELNRIEKSLSTRHIGTIKEYLPVVINEIQSAEKSITILCDFPAYGYFMDNENYKAYRLAILSKIGRGVKVSLMCLDADGRADSNRKILSITDENWSDWKHNQSNLNLLHILGYSSECISDLSVNDFLKALESVDQEMLDVFFKGADIETINTLLPFDFWLIDDMRAIFVFSIYSGNASQYGFITLDEKLVSGFGHIKDRYHQFKKSLSNT
ncbi:MAG TPA: hypothetical protein VGB73_18830 [Pyrinomonadaceae bacterium]|jgi:hypothetical protein